MAVHHPLLALLATVIVLTRHYVRLEIAAVCTRRERSLAHALQVGLLVAERLLAVLALVLLLLLLVYLLLAALVVVLVGGDGACARAFISGLLGARCLFN